MATGAKIEKIAGFQTFGPFLPRPVQVGSTTSVPRGTEFPDGEELMTVARCRERNREVIVKPSTLPWRAAVMANAKCRRCGRAAGGGVYCSSCAATIMAKALNPRYGGRRKKSASPEPTVPIKPSGQQRLFR